MRDLTFDEFRDYFNNLKDNTKDHRLGMFSVKIMTKDKNYQFSHLKHTYTIDEDFVGFSLINYKWFNVDLTSTKGTNPFYDGEEVDIQIRRIGFISAELYNNYMIVSTRKYDVFIKW